jgi:hypothetical protein
MTVQEHLQQARRNEGLAQRLGIPPFRTYDWAMTVLFYSILHFVDAYLLQRQGIVPKGHIAARDRRTGQRLPGRNDYVKQHLPQIAPAYQFLYSASRRARYDGAFLGPKSVEYYQRLRDNEFASARGFFRQFGW